VEDQPHTPVGTTVLHGTYFFGQKYGNMENGLNTLENMSHVTCKCYQ